MKNYIGCKMVRAVPAVRKGGKVYEAGWPIPRTMEPSEEGYKVVYADGYESWSPKAAFEKFYMQVQDNPKLPSGVSIGPDMVESFIKETHVTTLGEKNTVVRVVLANGFEIIESSACVDPKNYSEEVGADICMGKIKDKIWMLLGFLLQTAVGGVEEAHKK